MKTEEQIKEKIEQVFQKRLNQRIEKYLSRNNRNCLYNISKEIDGKEHLFCANPENPIVKKEIISICETIEDCKKCEHYVCKNTKEIVERQFVEDISDPSVCGIREPKLAVLLWVLNDKNKDEKSCSLFKFFKKIFHIKGA